MKIKFEKVVVLGYVDEESLGLGGSEHTSGCCYWCGSHEDKVVLRAFRMRCGRFEGVNLACKTCYRKHGGVR